jgi:hypothetical protein
MSRVAVDSGRVSNRMGDLAEKDGSLEDLAGIKALKWAALNWTTHCSFQHILSCTPRYQTFVFPDSDSEESWRPEREERSRRKFRRSTRVGRVVRS